MKTPQNFGGTCGVLNMGMSVIVILYVVVGFFGYMKYGSAAEGSITLNLPKDEMLVIIGLQYTERNYEKYSQI